MKILITGGFGFIGSHLLEELLPREDVEIHVVDDLSTSPLPLDYLLEEIGSRSNLSYSTCTVQEFCNSRMHLQSFDQVYHLASVVGPAGVLPHAGRIIRSIVDDTYSLINLAIECGARLLDVSTSEVYGGGQEGLCCEIMPMIVPPKYTVRLEYAVGKLAGEVALCNSCLVRPLDAVIVRPFNIAGPRQSGVGGFVVPRFIGLALVDAPLTIFGDGEQIRAFTNVKDMARGIILAMEKGQRGKVYNLGNPNNRCTINELADTVIAMTGSTSGKMNVDPKQLYGPNYEEANNKFPDSTQAMQELGWNPVYSKEETIRQALDYFLKLPDHLKSHLSGIT